MTTKPSLTPQSWQNTTHTHLPSLLAQIYPNPQKQTGTKAIHMFPLKEGGRKIRPRNANSWTRDSQRRRGLLGASQEKKIKVGKTALEERAREQVFTVMLVYWISHFSFKCSKSIDFNFPISNSLFSKILSLKTSLSLSCLVLWCSYYTNRMMR